MSKSRVERLCKKFGASLIDTGSSLSAMLSGTRRWRFTGADTIRCGYYRGVKTEMWGELADAMELGVAESARADCAKLESEEQRESLASRRDARLYCPLCGGDGWCDSSAELRRDGRHGDTTCIACDGRGWIEKGEER